MDGFCKEDAYLLIKKREIANILSKDEIYKLIYGYDDKLALPTNFLSLNDYIGDYEGFRGMPVFGLVEHDCSFLAINEADGQIVNIDHETNEMTYYVAKDSEHFLEAFAKIIDMEMKRWGLPGAEAVTYSEYKLRLLPECIEAAGGDQYAGFYEHLLNFEG